MFERDGNRGDGVMMRTMAAALAVSVALAGPALANPSTQDPAKVPAGTYVLDKRHASLTTKIVHMGFSHYTLRFNGLDGAFTYDPANWQQTKLTFTADPKSVDTNDPAFNKQIAGYLDADKFPAITFRSTAVRLTGPHAAKVTGNLTLHGVTKPVTLDVTYNGGYPANAMDPGGARIGFSAHGVFKRSAFGMGYGVPAAGSNMGVGDDVDVAIETEFSDGKPPAKK